MHDQLPQDQFRVELLKQLQHRAFLLADAEENAPEYIQKHARVLKQLTQLLFALDA